MLEAFLDLPRWAQVCIVVILIDAAFFAWLSWETKRAPLYADDDMRERIYTDEETREQEAREKRARKEAATRSSA